MSGAPTSPQVLAIDSLRALLADPAIPDSVRAALREEFIELDQMLAKLERSELHVAVFGRVSVGKSALLNALLGHAHFPVGVLHGTTTGRSVSPWQETSAGGIHLIDTPGINEVDGAAREALAHAVAARSDLVLFVVDGDLTASERAALAEVAATLRPLLLVLNKADRFTASECGQLLEQLRAHAQAWVRPDDVLAVAAQPAPRRVIRVAADGRESESLETPPPRIDALRQRMLEVLAQEGRTLAALNAGLFASRLSDDLGRRITAARADLAERLIRNYALGKGVAVGLNPVPVADLLSAAALDIALVVHLGQLYALPLTKAEAGELVARISAQLAALMGAIWGVHLVASALKSVSAGLSTALTAGAQGALAYYATFITGRAAQVWLQHGKSWGAQGPKRMVQQVLAGLDRNSILREGRSAILAKLKN